MDPNIRFIRVKGRIVPISKNKQLSMQLSKKKRERKAASTGTDFLQRGEASHELRKTARDEVKKSARAGKAAVFSAATSVVAGLGALGLSKFGKRGGKALAGLAILSGANALAGVANRSESSNAAKQLRKDATKISKGTDLGGEINRKWGKTRARRKSLFFQSYLADRQQPVMGPVDAAVLQPPPMIPPPPM